MLISPKDPQQIPVPVPIPVEMKAPPKVTNGSPPTPKVNMAPSLVVTSVPDQVQTQTYVTNRPKPNKNPQIKSDLPNASTGSNAPPQLVITPDAATATRNDRMITIGPARQAANNYPTFSIDSATPNRVCVISGLERRKTVEANGSTTYQGTLPTFRMVTAEVADLPAWHPLDSGCVISVTHKR